MSDQSPADRNLLFGVFALQMDFITRDQLLEGLQAWVLEKSKPLEELLIAKGFLAETHCQLLLPLMARHLEQHGNQATQSLQALSWVTPSVAVVQQIEDADLQKSLASLQIPETRSGELPTASFSMTSALGKSRYISLRPHAKGGLGEVFVARDIELDREVALKEIQNRHADDPSSRSRFLMEAEITGKLEHPGIVPIYGLGSYEDGRPFYAMRFIQGNSLQQAIEKFHQSYAGKPLDYQTVAFRKLLGQFMDVCQAVGFAHSRGVLHRDLKPGNVMLGKYGETLVVDWGLAKVKGGTAEHSGSEGTIQISSGSQAGETLPGSAIGTPGYMSPEQAEGKIDQLGPATDIYGLGATLFALLTGTRPIPGDEVFEIIRRTAQGDFPPPGEIHPHIPKALEAICLKAMSFSPGDRYTTCEELAEEVENFLAGEPVAAYPEPFFDRARRWVRNHRTLTTSLGAAVSVAVIALAVGFVMVAGFNRQLGDQNTELIQANQKEQQQRQRAEQQEQEAQVARRLAQQRQREASAQETLARLSALYAQEQTELQVEARKEAERQSTLAKKRLEQANKVASELIFTVDKKLENIPAASTVRRGLLDLAEKLLESLLVDAGDDPTTLALRAAQLNVRGEVALRYEDLVAAKQFLEDSLAISHKLSRQNPANLEAQRERSRSLYLLGTIARVRGKLKEAQTLLEESLRDRRDSEAAHPKNTQAQREVAESLDGLGDVAITQEEADQADKYFQEGLRIERKLLKSDPNDGETQRRVAISLVKLGDVARIQMQFRQAEGYYKEGVVLYRQLQQSHPGNSNYQSGLAGGLERLGFAVQQQDNRKAALGHYKESLAIYRALATADPDNVPYQRSLSLLLSKLGDVERNQKNLDQADSYFADSQLILRKLVKIDPTNANLQRGLAISCLRRGEVAQDQKKWTDAVKAFSEGLQVLDQMQAQGQIVPADKPLRFTLTLFLNAAKELQRLKGSAEDEKPMK